ncbi:PLP-dependent aminotransferase family protein [Roseovarius spongiae]|uniref:PLP-dependent aminotransferase family protein n=2 Tax=Roseovarius spongiae TaxID=2320272 RepID=A0A3A8AQL8_9RHOB|nr:PLP-dependent aminotransferase family protein [Roseovarius spongiae]
MQVVLAINPDDTRTLQTQVYEEFRKLILDGILPSGAPVPGSRTLSEQLGVSRNTVIIAYEKLLSEGYIESRANVGTFVSTNLPEASMRAAGFAAGDALTPQDTPFRPEIAPPSRIQKVRNPKDTRLTTDFWIGGTEPKAFPAREWRRTLEAKLRYGGGRIACYTDPQGLPELRQAITDHIGPARGISAEPDDIVITGGTQDSMSLIARAFAGRHRAFLHEDPTYQGARFLFHALGYACTPVPIDRHGIEVDKLPDTGPSLLYVTPSHQFPIGVTMSLERRLRLLDWAVRTDSLIIEDDYDGEFRYEGAPLSALRGLDRSGHVLYLGTFAKSFGPGLRLGFVIASPGTRRLLSDWKQLFSNGAPWLEQAAMADFMGNGGFRRHLRRIRAIYMARRDVLLEEIAQLFPGSETFGHRAGMHLSWRLPQPDAAERLQKLAALQRIGVHLPGTSASWISPRNRRHRDHLLMGYAAVDEKRIRLAMAALAGCMQEGARTQ